MNPEQAELARRAAELAALQAVTEVGLASLELDPLLQALLERLVDHEKAAAGVVYLREDDELVVRKAVGVSEAELAGLRVKVGEGLAGRVVAEGRPIAVPDVRQRPETLSPYAQRRGIQAILGVPLRNRGRVIGAVELDFPRTREFSPEETHLLEVVAERGALAIDRVRLVEDLRQERAFLQDVLELLPAAVAVIAGGPRHVAEYRNPALEKAFGEVIGKPASEFFPVTLPSGESVWEHVTRTGEPVSLRDYEYQAPGRGATYWDLYFWPIKSGQGVAQAILLVGWETTAHVQDRRRIEELAKLAERRARELEEEQARLQRALSMVAHDLRTPVTILRGYAQLLSRWEQLAPERREESLRAIEDATRRLERQTNDLLDASRIGVGRFEVQPKPMDLAALLRRVAQGIQATAPEHHIDVRAPAGLVGCWDEDRLAQVLNNLIGNAVKYSPDGREIRVWVERRDDEALLGVEDQGIGLTPEELATVFQPFRRGAAGRRAEGLGLGLYISKGIVEAHGGRIWAESPGPGRGSTFYVSLPISSQAHLKASCAS